MNLIQLLQYGRSRVQRRWVKGMSMDTSNGAVCATGAVLDTHPRGKRVAATTRIRAVKLLVECLPANTRTVVSYNDMFERTKADVVALYDRAIKLASVRAHRKA